MHGLTVWSALLDGRPRRLVARAVANATRRGGVAVVAPGNRLRTHDGPALPERYPPEVLGRDGDRRSDAGRPRPTGTTKWNNTEHRLFSAIG